LTRFGPITENSHSQRCDDAPRACFLWANRIAIARDYVAWNLGNTLAKCEPGTLRYQHVRDRRDERRVKTL